MFSGLANFISALSAAAIAVLSTILIYEGVPILRDIPFVGSIARGIIAGRIDEALEGYVLLSEKTALQAKIDKLERERLAGVQTLEEFRKRLEAEQARDAADEAQHDQEIADYEAKLKEQGRRCVLSDDDIKFLRHH